MAQQSFLARFEWWPDVAYWGGYPVALALVPAGAWGVWYELFELGKICFHLYWGVAALVTAFVMVYFRVTRLRRFNELMSSGAGKFLQHNKELEELVKHLPRSSRRAYKERLKTTTRRRT